MKIMKTLFPIIMAIGLAACAEPDATPRPVIGKPTMLSTPANPTATTQTAQPTQHSEPPKADDGHNAENALDWVGTYSGKTPEYAIMLLALNDDQTYALKTETKSRHRHITQGKFQWEKGGSIIRLDNQMRFFVAEGHLKWLTQGENSYPNTSHHTLQQISDIPAEISE